MEQEPQYRKSSYSSPNGDNCVEVAKLDDGGALVRHSKHPDVEPLRFNAGEWTAFVAGVRDDEF